MAPIRGIVVFSGGSAANSLVDVFETIRVNKETTLSYIIPISDNGGSSSELIRFFGGPGIGDVRSRLVRLIPRHPPSPERSAISALFNHRLSSTSTADAATDWQDIVSGTSHLWKAISSAKKELIRSFFNLLNLEILKRSRPPASTFDFTSASIGNLFLTGARLFSGSFESSIYLLSSLCGIPDDQVRVIPSLNSSFSHHIAAGLANGDVIVGQNSISHPSVSTALESSRPYSPRSNRARYSLDHLDHDVEDANLPGTLPTLRKPNIKFSKQHDEDLPARIDRIWYINPYGEEMSPPANPRVIEAVRDSQAIIYSIGSLFTSIIPSIILRGVGEALRSSTARHKILILNGSLDREVGPSTTPFTAVDFVNAIAQAAEDSRGVTWLPTPRPKTGELRSGNSAISSGASSPAAVSSVPNLAITPSRDLFVPSKYVTHLIHLAGDGVPVVERAALATIGIHCVKVYGRKIEVQSIDSSTSTHGVKYDAQALIGAIETILGKKGDGMIAGGKSRRNTLDA